MKQQNYVLKKKLNVVKFKIKQGKKKKKPLIKKSMLDRLLKVI